MFPYIYFNSESFRSKSLAGADIFARICFFFIKLIPRIYHFVCNVVTIRCWRSISVTLRFFLINQSIHSYNGGELAHSMVINALKPSVASAAVCSKAMVLLFTVAPMVCGGLRLWSLFCNLMQYNFLSRFAVISLMQQKLVALL